MTAKRHHYVPQLYLRKFALERKRDHLLEVFDLVRRKRFASPTDNIAVQGHFNTVDVPGHPPDVIETAMSQIEGEIATSLDRFLTTPVFDREGDFGKVLYLVALLAVRNPRFREVMRRMYESTVKISLEAMVSTPERWQASSAQAINAGHVAIDHGVTCRRSAPTGCAANGG